MRTVALFLAVCLGLFWANCRFHVVPCLVPVSQWDESILYRQIRDVKHPKSADYRLIQKYLRKGKREKLSLVRDYEGAVRNIRFATKKDKPEYGLLAVNASGKPENCLILYASYNANYPNALRKLVSAIAASDFQGSILYRIGGWPNAEEGDLAYAHVPYAFKPCLFREARRLGYRRVLWLDASILPLVSLNDLFREIQRKGYIALGNAHNVGPFFNEQAAVSLGVSLEESFSIPSCSAGVFGLDFSFETSAALLDAWFAAAKSPYGYYSARPEQNALSILLHKTGMRDWMPLDVLAEGENPPKTALFKLDRKFAHRWE